MIHFYRILMSIFGVFLLSQNIVHANACSGIMPDVRATALEIDNKFLEIEDELSNRYSSEIIPLLDDNTLVEKKIAGANAQLEAIERVMLLTNIEIKETISQIKLIRTKNEQNIQPNTKEIK